MTATTIFSTNPRVQGDRNFSFTINPGFSIKDQILAQIGGLDTATTEEVILHPIPGLGSSTVAFLRGRNNTFPTIGIVGPDGVNHGGFDLHMFRHQTARPFRVSFLETSDDLVSDAVIIVNSSGREIPEHQLAELQGLANTNNLVIATLQLGQVDLARPDLGEWLLETLVNALRAANVGESIANRPLIAITAGLSPVNAIIVTALHALCESWCSQPVAENKEGTFHFTDLIRLEEIEKMGRQATAETSPVSVPRDLYNRVLAVLEVDGNNPGLLEKMRALK